jgi:serine/threonine protein kinase
MEIEKVVGSGTFGVVFKATIKETGERVALKKFKLEIDPQGQGFPMQVRTQIPHYRLFVIFHVMMDTISSERISRRIICSAPPNKFRLLEGFEGNQNFEGCQAAESRQYCQTFHYGKTKPLLYRSMYLVRMS